MAREFAKQLYHSKAWHDVREYVLLRDKRLCQHCGAPAEEVHHITHLTPSNVWQPSVALNPANLISLCRDCHFREHEKDIAENMRKQNEKQANKYMLREDGTYFDEQGMLQKRQVYLVYGSPRSGKTTYVKQHMVDGDCVIDLDMLIAALQYKDERKPNNNLRWLAIDIREFLFAELEDESRSFDCKHVWIVGGFPLRKTRKELCEKVHATPIYIDTPQAVCEERARALNSYQSESYSVEIVRNWWAKFEP